MEISVAGIFILCIRMVIEFKKGMKEKDEISGENRIMKFFWKLSGKCKKTGENK